MKGLAYRSDVVLDLAMAVLTGARLEASLLGGAMDNVVDRSVPVVTGVRMDGAQLVAVELATDKAFTTAAFGESTETWAESTALGGSNLGIAATSGGRLVVLAGELPLRHDGVVVGGDGVSGAGADVDRRRAAAGLEAANFSAVSDLAWVVAS